MFVKGDKISHPTHGAGVIDGIVDEKIDGIDREFYVLKLMVNTMDVMIPVNTEVEIRYVLSALEADEVLSSLGQAEEEETQNWNKRYRDNMDRLKSGDLFEVARVVKSLTLRDKAKGLSTGERKMLHFARQILISEIVLSKDSTYEEMEQELDKALA
ncbi:MAG: CarD family transcriptional regulator [Eubacteriales bacterium]